MKKVILILALTMCFVENYYSQTLMSSLSLVSPATCTNCCDGSFTITPLGCTPNTYSITASAPIVSNLTINGFEYANVCYGVYHFTLTSNSCPSGTISYSVGYGTTTDINDLTNQKNEIVVYPNPTASIINISIESTQLQNSTIQITNNLGQIVFTCLFTSQIDLHSLPAGLYFLTIQDMDGKYTIKIIKE